MLFTGTEQGVGLRRQVGQAVFLDTTSESQQRGLACSESLLCEMERGDQLGLSEKPSLMPALRGRWGPKAAREKGPAPSWAEPPFLPWDGGPHSFLGSPLADTHLRGGCWVRAAAEHVTEPETRQWLRHGRVPAPRQILDSQWLSRLQIKAWP